MIFIMRPKDADIPKRHCGEYMLTCLELDVRIQATASKGICVLSGQIANIKDDKTIVDGMLREEGVVGARIRFHIVGISDEAAQLLERFAYTGIVNVAEASRAKFMQLLMGESH